MLDRTLASRANALALRARAAASLWSKSGS
nr:MAG TPA: hypothetical protein [Caudoviricetes sp.]